MGPEEEKKSTFMPGHFMSSINVYTPCVASVDHETWYYFHPGLFVHPRACMNCNTRDLRCKLCRFVLVVALASGCIQKISVVIRRLSHPYELPLLSMSLRSGV
jgi:hypothetical protein